MHYINFASTVKLFIARATGEQKPEQSKRTRGGIRYLQNKYTNPSTIFHVFSTCNFQGCSLIWKAARLRCPSLLKTKRYCEFAHFILKPRGQQTASVETQHLIFEPCGGGRTLGASPTSQTRLFPLNCWVIGVSSSWCSSSCSKDSAPKCEQTDCLDLLNYLAYCFL